MKAIGQVNLPQASPQDYARFAVLCAQKAASDSPEAVEFLQWVEIWRAGMDKSGATELDRACGRSAQVERRARPVTALSLDLYLLASPA